MKYVADTAELPTMLVTGIYREPYMPDWVYTASVEEIAEYLRVDSLAYLSVEGLMASVKTNSGFCQACFTGKYPVEFEGEGKDVFEVSGRRA